MIIKKGVKGIDISAWQPGFTDFISFKKAGYGYLICKISEGQSTDKCFEQHYTNCIKNNVPVGAYVFSHATNNAKAIAEANYALKILNGRKLDLPIFIDLEASDINYGWNVDITPVALAFGEVIKSAGYKWGVYANQSWLINKLDIAALRKAGAIIWCAKYSSEQPTVYCDIWQYADNGRVDFFKSNLDMNVAMNDIEVGDIVDNNEPPKEPIEEKPKEENNKITKAQAIEKVSAWFREQVGYREKRTNAQLEDKTANAGNNNWNKYADYIDKNYPAFYNGRKNGYSWCDIFVDCGFIQVFGYENALKMLYQPEHSAGAGCTYSANYYRANNAFYNYPQVGDQVFFGDYGNEGHTGFVVEVNGDFIYTIEGNTSSGYGVESNGDGVYLKRYNIKTQYIPGYGRPNWSVVVDGGFEDTSTGGIDAANYPLIKRGSKNEYVKKAQQILIKLGYDVGPYKDDGDFGYGTYQAVVKFQKDNGLEADGIVGKNTWAVLIQKEKELNSKPDEEKPPVEEDKPIVEPDPVPDDEDEEELPVVKYGCKDKAVVEAMQTLLKLRECDIGEYGVDGDFGKGTLTGLKEFQEKTAGLVMNGECDKKTWIKLIKGE